MLSSPIQGLGPFFRGSCSVEGRMDQSPFDVYLLYLWIPSNSHLQKAGMRRAEGPAEVHAVGRLLAPANKSFLPELASKAQVLPIGRLSLTVRVTGTEGHDGWWFLLYLLLAYTRPKHTSGGFHWRRERGLLD